MAAARQARGHAVADYSHFKVGAALETIDGTIVTGCNIENATYGLTICAERVAMFKALSEGHREFRRIAIVADTAQPTPPCGACRQILWEFAGDIGVILASLTRQTGRHRLRAVAAAVRRTAARDDNCSGPGLYGSRLSALARGTSDDNANAPAHLGSWELGVGSCYDQSAMLPTIDWTDDAIVMIDQRKLPVEEVYVRCRTAPEVAKAIKTMVVRGAPAIGVAAGMGLALGVRQSKSTGTQKLASEFARYCDMMAGTRPTAVNLFWAIDRMKRAFADGDRGR